jgi:hypothetical protein
MKKSILILLVALCLVLCFFLGKELLFKDSGIAENGSDSSEVTVSRDEDLAPTPTLTPEEYDAMIQQEIEELQEEDPLMDENGEEIPSLDVSDGDVIVIGEDQGAGSL